MIKDAIGADALEKTITYYARLPLTPPCRLGGASRLRATPRAKEFDAARFSYLGSKASKCHI